MLHLYENFANNAQEKGIKLIIPNTEKLLVVGDSRLLKICFSNLVDNAIQYSADGNISILVKSFDNKTNIKVIDNGMGISEKYHQQIFERFFRVESSRSRSLGGYGLGLSIVKHILKAHKSEIVVESKLGQGSTFSFSLSKTI